MSFTSLLNAACTIQSLSTSVNALGQVERAYSAGTAFSCRFNAASGDEEELAGRTISENVKKLYLPDTADVIAETSRVVSEGLNYNVIRVDKHFGSSNIHHFRAFVERIV